MIKISILANDPVDIMNEVEHIYESAPPQAKEDLDMGRVIVDLEGLTGKEAAVLIAALHGVSGVFPFIIEGIEDTPLDDMVDLHEIRMELFRSHSEFKDKK